MTHPTCTCVGIMLLQYSLQWDFMNDLETY